MTLKDKLFALAFGVFATVVLTGLVYVMTHWYSIVDYFLY